MEAKDVMVRGLETRETDRDVSRRAAACRKGNLEGQRNFQEVCARLHCEVLERGVLKVIRCKEQQMLDSTKRKGMAKVTES